MHIGNHFPTCSSVKLAASVAMAPVQSADAPRTRRLAALVVHPEGHDFKLGRAWGTLCSAYKDLRRNTLRCQHCRCDIQGLPHWLKPTDFVDKRP